MTVQTGQNILSGFPANGLIHVDNGGAQVAALPCKAQTVVLNGTTPVTVADTGVTNGSIVMFTLKTVGGTVGAIPVVETITPGTGFTVAGTAGDTSTYNVVRIG
jgi:hypothetical protein